MPKDGQVTPGDEVAVSPGLTPAPVPDPTADAPTAEVRPAPTPRPALQSSHTLVPDDDFDDLPTRIFASPISQPGVVAPTPPTPGAPAPAGAPIPSIPGSTRTVIPVPRPPLPATATHPAPLAAAPSPVVAALFSLVIPGAGQMYLGQVPKGAVLLILAFFTCGAGCLLNLASAADAYLIGQRRQKGEVVDAWKFF